MHVILLSLSVVMLVGCGGSRNYVSHKMHSIEGGKENVHYHNMVTLRDKDSLFHNNDAKNWMERCERRIENPQTQDEFAYPFTHCHREQSVMESSASTMATQFVAPVTSAALQAGGLASMGYLIGKGLGNSKGTTVNNANSQSQDQGQGQEQGQGQSQGIKGGHNPGHKHGKH